MDLGIADRTALVTGSYRGTGSAIARSLAAEGVHVLVHGLEDGQPDEVVAGILDTGGRATAVVGDLLSDAGAEMYACQMTVDMMDYNMEEFHDGVDSIVGAMEMLEMADGAQIIFV